MSAIRILIRSNNASTVTSRVQTKSQFVTHLFTDRAEPFKVLDQLFVSGFRSIDGVRHERDLIACVGWVRDDTVDRLGETILLPEVARFPKETERRLGEWRYVVEPRTGVPLCSSENQESMNE